MGKVHETLTLRKFKAKEIVVRVVGPVEKYALFLLKLINQKREYGTSLEIRNDDTCHIFVVVKEGVAEAARKFLDNEYYYDENNKLQKLTEVVAVNDTLVGAVKYDYDGWDYENTPDVFVIDSDF